MTDCGSARMKAVGQPIQLGAQVGIDPFRLRDIAQQDTAS